MPHSCIISNSSRRDKGVCGVARFPSVAIGATLIQDINKWQSGSNPNDKMVTQSLLSLSSTQSILVKSKPIICSNRVVSYIVACAIIIVIGIVVILYRHFSRSRRLDLSRQTQFRDYGSINVPLTRS